ncbi:hypothetical protein [Membranihabitans marinus]|nr:hypothetical protein [Membranihabitans marinus]
MKDFKIFEWEKHNNGNWRIDSFYPFTLPLDSAREKIIQNAKASLGK